MNSVTKNSLKLINPVIVLTIVGLAPTLINADDSKASAQHIVSTMPANSWLEVPNTQLADVGADAEKYADLQGYIGIDGVTAYSGGVFDNKRNRLVIWGGGHWDYMGNEVYAFDVDTLSWERLTDPSDPNYCEETNSDGTPNSRHTYNGIAYIDHADRMFGSGGALACRAGGCGARKTWVFDFDLKQWTDMNPKITPETDCENLSAYDPESKKVWWFDLEGLWSYDYDKNSWTKHNEDFISRRTAVVDTKRGLLIAIGEGEVVAYDIRNRNFTQKVWSTKGADELVEQWSPGVAYDPVTDRIVSWSGGDSIYTLNIDTKVWTEHQAKGGPNLDALNSVYGIWRYVSSLNAFIIMPGTLKNVYFYKLPESGL
ncbi:MAG: hypothetical protein R8G33_00295 [Gammaproteobacteria bacterium]|nr:hypothetical protein [Gammaproteobacteria bacterium]